MEEFKKIVNNKIKELGLWIDSVEYVKGKQNVLNIIIDSNEIINTDKIVIASKIINPIIDKCNLIKEKYIVDIYSKEKGSVKDE